MDARPPTDTGSSDSSSGLAVGGRVLALVASTLALLAGVAGCILWMRLGTGKDFATLFQAGAERQATYNTMFNLWQYLAYAIAAFTAYYCAMPRALR